MRSLSVGVRSCSVQSPERSDTKRTRESDEAGHDTTSAAAESNTLLAGLSARPARLRTTLPISASRASLAAYGEARSAAADALDPQAYQANSPQPALLRDIRAAAAGRQLGLPVASAAHRSNLDRIHQQFEALRLDDAPQPSSQAAAVTGKVQPARRTTGLPAGPRVGLPSGPRVGLPSGPRVGLPSGPRASGVPSGPKANAPMQDAGELFPPEKRTLRSAAKGEEVMPSPQREMSAKSIPGSDHTPGSFNVSTMLPQYAGEEIGGLDGPRQVKYMTADEKAASKITVRNGMLVDARGQLLDTSVRVPGVAAGNGRAIYVMDPQGDIYVSGPHANIKGNFQHSCFVSGGPVAAAGEIGAKDGVVHFVSPKSGHYKPTPEQFQQFLDRLVASGVQLDGVIDRTFR